jgi:hypothetical protein
MRLITTAILLGTLLPTFANAASATAYGSDTPFNIVNGDNLIDGPHMLNCKNANGCLLTLSVYATHTGSGGDLKTCIFVDGADPMPMCDWDGINPVSKNAFSKVTQGTHTVEMHMFRQAGGDQVLAWETEYALYRK